MENERIIPINENFFHSNPQPDSLYTKNLKNNREKLSFWTFLVYSTKAEIYICEFHNLLFWVSLLELFLYVIGVALFISSPKNFSEFWAFTTHAIRAILGLIVLRRLPNSSDVIEEIKEFDNSTIEDVQIKIFETYKNLLSKNEGRVHSFLKAYFAFTIIDIIVDNIIFFFLLHKWSDSNYSLDNIFALILILVFFLCNGVYFSWAASIKFNFPSEMRKPVFSVMFGQLTSLQNFFVKSAKNVYSKTVNRLSRNRQADNQNRNMPNSVELNVNVNTNVNIIHKNDDGKNYRYDRPQIPNL